MNKIDLFDKRQLEAERANATARDFLLDLVDKDTFVEQDPYFFAGNDLYDNNVIYGEGIVCAIAEIGGKPTAFFKQNIDVLKGGLSSGAADKIIKLMVEANYNNIPLVSILSTNGARIGEGVRVLEGYSKVLKKMASLRGKIPLITVIDGEVFGLLSMFPTLSDVVIMLDKSVLCSSSPLVVASSKGKNSKDIGTAETYLKNGLAHLGCKKSELSATLDSVLDIILDRTVVNEGKLNEYVLKLNDNYSSQVIANEVFDTHIELSKDFATEVKTIIASVGGVSVGAIVFGDDEGGVELTASGCRKISEFVKLCDRLALPLINFVNCKGFEANADCETELVQESANMFAAIAGFNHKIISIVGGVAVGAIYSCFVSHEVSDYTFAFATSSISVLTPEAEAALDASADKSELVKKYRDLAGDVWNYVVNGNIDNVIEPSTVKQYILSVLI